MKKIKLYHGSNKPIRKFNRKYSAQGVFWFSEDKDKILQGRSGASKVDYLIEVEVSVNKTAGWPEYNKFSLGEIENMKYDSIKLDDDWIIFDSNNIKVIKAHNVKKLKEKTYYTNLSTYEVNERPDNLLRVNTIFKNNFAYPIQVDDYINQLFDKVNYNPDLYKTCFQSLPDTMVDVTLIIPTQLYLLKSKMRKYKDKPVNNNSGERPEGIWFDGLFYLLDGHHRVAKMISKGYNYIACKGLNISIPKISENTSRKFIDSVYFFLNEYSYPKTVMKLISTLTKEKTSKGLKYVEVLRNKGLELIPTNKIIPTYENLLSSIMKDILSYKSDKVSEFVKYGENYYLINDHYKVAKEIFEGNKFIKGKVVDMNTRLNNKFTYSPEIYRPVFEN